MTAVNPALWGYPVVLPNMRDPRLHLASVIISIHILGQTVLGFEVSVPQILSAILSAAILEIVITFRRTRQFVWPASAMLTGSGVALIFRVIGTERGDHWSWGGWYLFALVAAFSLATKYLFTFRGAQLFNPSNVGLVIAFLLLGSERVEPLDFWWAPLTEWMILAYLIIAIGGIAITSRMRLLAMAAAFWLSLAVALGLVATWGHCITAAWALQPVCGLDFWRTVMTSPEVLIFLFFMITDPKTIPSRAPGRIAFGLTLGLVCSFLTAPMADEFGAKVGLLGGLVLLTPLRLLFEPAAAPRPATFRRGLVIGASGVMAATALVLAGSPARPLARIVSALPEVEANVDAAPLPPVTIDADVAAINADLDEAAARALALTLIENLAVEGDALAAADSSLLRAVNHGPRLVEMEHAIETGEVRQERVVPRYQFDSLHLGVVYQDGGQGGASLAFYAEGAVEEVAYDLAGLEESRKTLPFNSIFVMAQPTGERWLLVAVLPQT